MLTFLVKYFDIIRNSTNFSKSFDFKLDQSFKNAVKIFKY